MKSMKKEFWSRYREKFEYLRCRSVANSIYDCVEDKIDYVFFNQLCTDHMKNIREVCTADEVEDCRPMLAEFSAFRQRDKFMIYLLVCNEGEQYEEVTLPLKLAGFKPQKVCF